MKVISLTFLYYIALLALQSSFSFVRQSVAVTSLAGLITKSSNKCVVNLHAPFRTTPFGGEKAISFQLKKTKDLKFFSPTEFFMTKKNIEVLLEHEAIFR